MAEQRLIDANALPMHKVKIVHAFGIVEGCVVFPDSVANTPTIDAVEVVRCVECKHRANHNSTLGFSWCGKFGNVMRDSDFCSWGERKMDAKEE